MTSKYLLTLAALLLAGSSFAQVVYPGGGVASMSDVPGLTNAIGQTLTNGYKGADTGGATGNVQHIGRQLEINFPTVPSTLYVITNFVNGTAYIDASGTTTVSYGHVFTNAPFVTLTPVGTNLGQIVTAARLTKTTTNFSFVVFSSGNIVTNPYAVDWQANDGYGMSKAGPAFDEIGGITNIFLLNGTNALQQFYFPVGYGAGKWLVCNSLGYGSWQDKTLANLTDGSTVFKKDGTVTATGDFDMGGKDLLNATRIQVTTGAGAGRFLMSDASGYGTWSPLSAWSPASSALNMNGFALSGVGPLTINGTALFSGTEQHNGTVSFNSSVNFAYGVGLASTAPLSSSGRAAFYKTGGSYGTPDFLVSGYERHNDVADFRGTVQANSLIYANSGILAIGNASYYDCALLAAPAGSHIGSEGNIYAGDAAYIQAGAASALAPYGNIVAQNGLYCQNVFTKGNKPFRIEHPRDPKKWLYHAAIESPDSELLYRGKTTLVRGKASVNLNTYYGLLPNTLDLMLTNLTATAYNNAGWTPVRCKVTSAVTFEIEALTPWCGAEVEWIAIGTRCDAGVKDYRIEANK